MLSLALLHLYDDNRLLSWKRAPKLADWLVPKNGNANLIDHSAINSKQQEVMGL